MTGRPAPADLRKRASEAYSAVTRRIRSEGEGYATPEEKAVLTEAYWASALPRDPDRSVAQWVEDGFPRFG